VTSSIASVVGRNATTVAQLIQGDSIVMVAGVLEIAAAVLAMLLIHEIDGRQKSKLAQVTTFRSTMAAAG
jgi:hypothetical protein